ncbi:MAG: thiamine-phosphate kinase [Thermodesulfobacteriota bacterium]
MFRKDLKKALRFYYITDENAPGRPPLEQVEIAIRAGATIVQYRHKSFTLEFFDEVAAIRHLCKCNGIPFLVNDHILLAQAVSADGVHLGQTDESPVLARRLLGPDAIVGISVSNLAELARTDLAPCDYIGTGPVFATRTKADAKPVCGLGGLAAVVQAAPLPVVAIGGITPQNAAGCFRNGAAGVAAISHISRAENPLENARQLGSVCQCPPPADLSAPWNDEFGLLHKLLKLVPLEKNVAAFIKIPPGDDASLLNQLKNPVVTTDTHKEGIHFRLDWQTPREVGRKAVTVTLSDLAASYALPIALFVNLTLPAHVSDGTIEALYQGIRTALNHYQCALGGGNISKGCQLSLDLFAVGEGRDDIFPLRSAARPGYGLYATGPLGLARAGLDALTRKDDSAQDLISRFKLPRARFDAARVLAEHQVPCVIDISDGLAGDAGHIAAASGLSIEFDLSLCLKDPALEAYCAGRNITPEEMILSGGEDYELLFSCPPETFNRIQKFLPAASQVGRCLPFAGKHLLNVPPGIASFQHGRR